MAESMVVFVFLYVLLMRLLYTSCTWLSTKVLRLWTTKMPQENSLKDSIMQLKGEQLKISAQDEFAKYARLQRKISKLNEELSQHVKERKNKMSRRQKILVAISIGLLAICHIAFLVKYRKHTVTVLPEEWFSPIGSVLAFPTGLAVFPVSMSVPPKDS